MSYLNIDTSDFITSQGFQQLGKKDWRTAWFSDVIYRRGKWRDWFAEIHPQIPGPYTLLSNFHDRPVDFIPDCIDDAKFVGWYANNVAVSHPKIVCIPRGVKREVLAKAAAVRGQQRTILCYANFKPYGHRAEVARLFSDRAWCVTRYDKSDPSRYWQELASSHFAISPPGNGEDCYRTWEAILVGTIPIVRHSFLDPLYSNLPVLIVDSWEQVTLELLETTLKGFAGRAFNGRILSQSYWNQRIRTCSSTTTSLL